MADGKSLKEQNAGLIRAAMIGHIVVFAWIASEPLRLLSMNGRMLAARLEAAADDLAETSLAVRASRQEQVAVIRAFGNRAGGQPGVDLIHLFLGVLLEPLGCE